MADELRQILNFLHQAEKLKNVLRHSWTSTSRRESVAEHSWRMALMAMLLAPYLQKPVDLLRVIKMTLVHDLVEINYADHPAFKKGPANKAIMERKSLAKLIKSLPAMPASEIAELWEEYEATKSQEARFAKFLDKTEVLLQHNEAPLKHMTKKEYPFNLVHGLEHSQHDETLKLIRELINEETLKHYQKNKVSEALYKTQDNRLNSSRKMLD